MSPRVLLVDDESNIRRMVSALLQSDGYDTVEAADGNAAMVRLTEDAPDVVLLDLMMPPGPDGLATLEQIRKRAPHIPVVMMSGKANLADAVRATKLGAFQFLEKPLTPEGVLVALRSALELGRTLAENTRLHEQLGHADPLVGTSTAMDELRALIARVAPTESRVLITGESGTGKELVASAIHRLSARGSKAFVTVNSAALPRDLVESEMFGHERGAFTGATDRRQGRFELADGGTLFLDEVGDLGPEAQAKLLRVLESGIVERVGGERPFAVNVRVIAATNKDLPAGGPAGTVPRGPVVPAQRAADSHPPAAPPRRRRRAAGAPLRRALCRPPAPPRTVRRGCRAAARGLWMARERARAREHRGAAGDPRNFGPHHGGGRRACPSEQRSCDERAGGR